jgi:hypothetical protein
MILCKCGTAAEVRRNYIMGCVPAPVRDCSVAQLLDVTGKSTYLITAIKGRATNVLHGIPRNATYDETLLDLEDRVGDQHFAAAFRSQLKTRTQRAGESQQKFATAIEQLAHRAYSTLPEENIRREAGKGFADGVEDPDIKTQLLLRGRKC